MRSQIWRDTDPARTGMLPFAFEPGMGFERYVDYALDVPLYFVKRGAVYHLDHLDPAAFFAVSEPCFAISFSALVAAPTLPDRASRDGIAA